jgi:hypothetical protein
VNVTAQGIRSAPAFLVQRGAMSVAAYRCHVAVLLDLECTLRMWSAIAIKVLSGTDTAFEPWCYGHYAVCYLPVSGNSRSVAAMALTAAGSSLQWRAVRVQAWKFVTFDALAASVSSAHASRSSAWSSGDMGAPGTRSAATTGLMGAAVAPLRPKRLLRPISVPPFPSAQSINVLSMRPRHYDRAPSPMAKRIAAAEQTR